MARRLGLFLFVISLSVVGVDLLLVRQEALAAGLDPKGEADAKEATRLFKQGRYEEAAPIYAKLSVDYPDLEVFERNIGACYYHLRKPEPALSNLRHYLGRKKNIGAEDKATVERWIDEMEKLRAQNEAPSVLPVTPIPTPPTGAEEPGQTKPVESVGPVSPSKTNDVENKPPGLTFSKRNETEPNGSAETVSPFYKKWWFWTGVGVVAAGTVTAFLIAERSNSPCAGASMTCLEAK